jgi:Tfp pilus assembly protein PilN
VIKINLLPQKRAKRTQQSEGGQREMAIGIGALVAVAALTFFAFDQPKRSKLHDLRASNDQLQQEIAAKNAQLLDFPKLKLAADEAKERERSINRLIAAKVVPANVLHELGEILTPNHLPMMTAEMTARTSSTNVKFRDPNRVFDLAWDPNHVWLTSFTDSGGTFKLEGGAQAENDITQLSKRLQASVYFTDISPSMEQRVADKDTGTAYYNFTITGKVAY